MGRPRMSVVPSDTAITIPNGATNSSRSQNAPGSRSRLQSRLAPTTVRERSPGFDLRPLLVPQLQLCSAGGNLPDAVNRLVKRQRQEWILLGDGVVEVLERGRGDLRVAEVIDVGRRVGRVEHEVDELERGAWVLGALRDHERVVPGGHAFAADLVLPNLWLVDLAQDLVDVA